jgi:lactate dehydrogenase-like 2-hydroxyacid dehydrogenase
MFRYSPNSIAEFTVGLAINLGRHLSMAFDRAKRGDFKLTPKLLGFESMSFELKLKSN